MNKECLKSTANRWVPYGMGVFAYHCFFLIFRACVKLKFFSKNYRIWHRNSLKNAYLEPFISDIDVTLLIDPDWTGEDLRSYRSLENFFRGSIFPLLGETNIYRVDYLTMLRYANELELRRDPELHKSLRAREPSRAETAVFLARMLEADAKNVLANNPRRRKKWNYHFEQCLGRKLSLQQDLFSEISQALVELLELKDASFSQDLQKYLTFMRNGLPLELWRESLPCSPSLEALYFHRYAFFNERKVPANSLQADCFLANFQWEIFAAFTHSYFSRNKEDFPCHLSLLFRKFLELTGAAPMRPNALELESLLTQIRSLPFAGAD